MAERERRQAPPYGGVFRARTRVMERADLQRDLVAPLTRMAQLEPDKAHAYLGRALQILRTLKSAGRQFAQLDEWIAILEQSLEQLGPANY